MAAETQKQTETVPAGPVASEDKTRTTDARANPIISPSGLSAS
jgi:hypothetical protein